MTSRQRISQFQDNQTFAVWSKEQMTVSSSPTVSESETYHELTLLLWSSMAAFTFAFWTFLAYAFLG